MIKKFDSVVEGSCENLTLGSLTADATFKSDNYFTQFTLRSGSYNFECDASAYRIDDTQLKVYNVTDASYVMSGPPINEGDTSNTLSVHGSITINTPKIFELRQYTSRDGRIGGLGFPSPEVGNSEVYSTCKITRYK